MGNNIKLDGTLYTPLFYIIVWFVKAFLTKKKSHNVANRTFVQKVQKIYRWLMVNATALIHK